MASASEGRCRAPSGTSLFRLVVRYLYGIFRTVT